MSTIEKKYNQSIPLDKRRAGVLLHPTSLPGPYHNGVLGEDAYRFIDVLQQTGFTVWQTLPLGPTHSDGSPYQSLSVHAGSPDLIDLQWLVDRDWLLEQDLQYYFADVLDRSKCLLMAFDRFHQHCTQNEHSSEAISFQKFIEEESFWLEDYALYCTLKKEHQQKSWIDWPDDVKNRNKKALSAAKIQFKMEILYHQFEQYLFFSQWLTIKEYANNKGIYLFGDLPIFVAHDSADVWAHRTFFKLDKKGNSQVVAGVPPDYFSATGQRWGNPHYQWDTIEASGFSWWIERIKTQQLLFDLVRIDHFRGFEASWEIPVEEDTAMNGQWVKSPGQKLLTALYQAYPDLTLVAEDLGIITREVDDLREQFNLPGMKIMQFAFSGEATNPYLPHNHQINSVVYTGTHDNDTTVSWLDGLDEGQKHIIREYFNFPYDALNKVLMSQTMASVAKLAILPLQDIMDLGEGSRMNTPGTAEGNWQWRFSWKQLTDDAKMNARHMNILYGRTE